MNSFCDPSDRKESTSTGPTKLEVQIVAQFDNHNSQVWRVSWNITSTLLASSGDDGCVRLWKGNKLMFAQVAGGSSVFSVFLFLGDMFTMQVEVNSRRLMVTLAGNTFLLLPPAANYMDNWKCTGILKGDGSPLTGSSGQPTAMSTVVGSSVQTSQSTLNGMSAGR